MVAKLQIPSEYNIKLPKWDLLNFSDAASTNSDAFNTFAEGSLSSGREVVLYRLLELRDVIGGEGLDLLNQLIHIDPSSRLSAKEALQHPYFNSMPSPSPSIQFQSVILDQAEILRDAEASFSPDPLYMSKQPSINENMR